MIVLGLAEENMARLLAGEATTVDLEGLGLPPSVLIVMGGHSDDEMVERLTTLGLIQPGQLPDLN